MLKIENRVRTLIETGGYAYESRKRTNNDMGRSTRYYIS